MRKACVVAASLIFPAGFLSAQSASSLSEEVRQYVVVDAPVVALMHVKVIDGTGGPARDDQVIVIADGVIQAVGEWERFGCRQVLRFWTSRGTW